MSGDLKDGVIDLFLGTAALNVADRCGRMPLHCAAENSNGDTALHLASRNGHEEVVVWLFKRGATSNLLNSMGKSALHLAAAAGQLGIVITLVQHGADIWMKDRDDATPVIVATENRHHGATTVLAEYTLKSPSMRNGTASELLRRHKLTLHDAAQYGCPVVAEKLMRSGADIHKRDASGMTPLSLLFRDERRR